MERSYIDYCKDKIKPSKKYQEKLDKLSREYQSKVYDLQQFRVDYTNIILNAECEWRDHIQKDFKKDVICTCLHSSTVGFWVNFLKNNRYRKPQRGYILRPPTSFQGSLTWEKSMPKIKKLLRDSGIDCNYDYGVMD